jgi:hypothetical protein
MTEPRSSDVVRLRGNMDRGRTGDMIENPDPAAAPLGTDDETAGALETLERLGAAARQPPPGRPDEPPAASQRRQNGLPKTMVLFFVVVAIVALAMFFVSRGGGP